jgi:hypothetical protein
MLRIIRPGNPIYTGGIDPNATFTPGEISELSIIGNQIILKSDKEEKEKDAPSSSSRQ